MPVEISDIRRTVFGGLIDYAGLFPPAGLDMESAVAGYRAARSSRHDWMVDRFIVPASRLEELAAQLTPTMDAGEPPWRLSVLSDQGSWPAFAETHRAIATYLQEMAGASTAELVEVKLPAQPDEGELGEAAAGFVRLGAIPFFEMPADELPVDVLAVVRRRRDIALGAKLRCGGVTAELFPSSERVAEFIASCTGHSLPFKCTAGLHHPLRHHDPATGFIHHGFLNILVASLAAAEGSADLVEIISDTDPGSFGVGRAAVSWRGRKFSPEQVSAARAGGFVGYGSCDFDEPVGDLTELGMLP